MLPRSCLEDMAWRYSGTTKIGEYQVAAGGWSGRPVGLSQSVTVTQQNRVLLLQIETFSNNSAAPFEETTATLTFLNNLILHSLR